MTKLTMYVVTMTTGTYDGTITEIMSVTDDLNKGQSYVDHMNMTFTSMDKKINTLRTEVLPQWYKDNPRPTCVMSPLKNKKDKTSTKDSVHPALLNEYSKNVKTWQENLKNFTKDTITEALTPEELKLYEHADHNYWSIEEAPWLS